MFFPFPNFEHVTRRVFKVKEIIHHSAITLRGKQNERKTVSEAFSERRRRAASKRGVF